MLPIVLGSFVAYAVTAALLLLAAHRFVLPVGRRAALALAAAPLLFTGQAMFTGGVFAPLDIAYQAEPLHALSSGAGIERTVNPQLVDVVSQMLPWRHAVREAIAAGRLPLWNRYVLAGAPLAAVAQPGVLQPWTWLGMLLPPPQSWTFDVSLRLFGGLLCAYLFFRGTAAGEAAAFLGACAWTFSDFLFFYAGYPLFSSVAPFPLLLLGLLRLVDDADRRAVGLTVCALVLTVIAGHPETLLFSVAGGGVFFLFELARAERGRRWRPVLLSLIAGAAALGLTAVMLLPFLEAVPQSWQHSLRAMFYAKQRRSVAPLESLRRLVPSLVPYAYGTFGRSQIVDRLILPAAYAGSLVTPLAAAGLFARSRRKWIFLGLGLLGAAVEARLVGVADLVARIPLFDIAMTDYFIFLSVFGLVALAVLGADGLARGEGVAAFAGGAVATIVGVLVVAAARGPKLREIGMAPSYPGARIGAQILPLLVALGIVLWLARRSRLGAGALAALCLLLLGQRRIEEADVYPTYPARAFYPPIRLLDSIPRGEPVRMTGLRWTLTPNIAAMYGVEDVRGYDAMILLPLAETFGLWCEPQPGFYNRVDDPTRPFLAFLNVRYVVGPPGFPTPVGWTLRAEQNGSRLFENPRALPRAFAPRHLVWTDNPAVQMMVLARIWDFGNDGVADAVRPGRLRWQDNGEADVRIVSYAAERMSMSIEARGATLIGTSIPAWKGWRLTLDGQSAPLVGFNHAFLGFETPPGRHEAVLRYLPDGFVYGAGISLATLVACAVLVGKGRRKSGAP